MTIGERREPPVGQIKIIAGIGGVFSAAPAGSRCRFGPGPFLICIQVIGSFSVAFFRGPGAVFAPVPRRRSVRPAGPDQPGWVGEDHELGPVPDA